MFLSLRLHFTRKKDYLLLLSFQISPSPSADAPPKSPPVSTSAAVCEVPVCFFLLFVFCSCHPPYKEQQTGIATHTQSDQHEHLSGCTSTWCQTALLEISQTVDYKLPRGRKCGRPKLRSLRSDAYGVRPAEWTLLYYWNRRSNHKQLCKAGFPSDARAWPVEPHESMDNGCNNSR